MQKQNYPFHCASEHIFHEIYENRYYRRLQTTKSGEYRSLLRGKNLATGPLRTG
jgi:hypothetical protein